MLRFIVSIFLLFTSSAQASEVLLNAMEIKLLLSDQVLYGEIDSHPFEQIFQKSGVTFYSTGGGQSQGTWNVTGNQYCSVWPPNLSPACYDVASNKTEIIFISKSGKRLEMRLTK